MSEGSDIKSVKAIALTIFATVTFVLGLILGSAIIFITILVLTYLALIFIQFSKPHADISVQRTLEKSQIHEEELTRVRLRVTNTGKAEIPLLTVMDTVPRECHDAVMTKSSFTLALQSGETKYLFYAMRGNTFGVFTVGPILLKSTDQFGISDNERKVENFSSLVVIPRLTERLIHFKIKPRKTKPWPGEIPARKVGLGIDNYSIRQYIPGDSFRRINWRASARQSQENGDDLLLNEQMADRGADTMVIVDARPVSNVGKGKDSIISQSVHAAIFVADRLLKDRNRVGLFTVGLSSERIPPGYGRRQYNRLVLSLIKLRPGEFYTFENLPSYLKFFYPNLAQVVIISPLNDDKVIEAAAEVARSRYELLVISPNPLDFSGHGTRENTTEWKIGAKLAELKRQSNLALLRKSGSLVVDWRKSDSLDYVLSKNLRAWSRQLGTSSGARTFR